MSSNLKLALSFDDVLIEPKFSTIESRKDVNTSVEFLGKKLQLGVISSNMDTVTGPKMAEVMNEHGAAACLHRFTSIQNNTAQYKSSPKDTLVSVGLGGNELERAEALQSAGASRFIIDVAHGASTSVVKQVKKLRKLLGDDAYIVAGNFASAKTVRDFLEQVEGYRLDAIKLGIGGGSVCTTRVVTGSGAPTLQSILECSQLGLPIIADGGIRNSGDLAKAFAAGATAVMIGKLLAGTDESPGEIYHPWDNVSLSSRRYKNYRGSASLESYQVQNKEALHRTPEGESIQVPYTGPAKKVLLQLEAGLKSAMSYSGARTIEEFQRIASFIQVTSNGVIENGAHGKSD